MTYTFKLSRRLAVSRWAATPIILIPLAAACMAGDAAEGLGPEDLEVDRIVVIPRTAVVEVNQPLQYRAFGLTARGDTVAVEMDWTATGGNISADGVFKSSTTGRATVLGNGHGRGKAKGHAKKDSSDVVVVPPPPPDMEAIIVSPDTANLNTAQGQQFTAKGRLSDGSTVDVGVSWTATGGSIDPGGYYTAGQTIGVYQATATHSGTQKSGSAVITISPPPPPVAPTSQPPELPRVFLDTDYRAPTGQSVTVPAGGNLQAALNAAQPGDEIVLEAGATYRGTFTLPEKSGSGWIIVRSSAMGSLPGEGQRVGPGDAGAMAKLEAQNGDPALRTAPRARQWRIMGLEITAATSVSLSYGLVRLGTGGSLQSSLNDVPTDLILDRVYVHGHSNLELQRCVTMNSAASAVIGSYLSECHMRGFDSQAIVGWNGPGPFKIVNNYLEGAGENVMFGGARPRIPNLVPSDIEIRRNHFYKPLAWQAAGWTVKNLFELKNAQRVLVEGNVFENNWKHAQTGFAILFQATLNGGNVTWARVRDITFRYNRITHSAGGINLLSRAAGVDEPSMRISFTHNVLDRIGTDPALGTNNGILLQLLGDHQHVVFAHNTGFSPYLAVYLEGGGKAGTIIRDNILQRGAHGIGGRGTSEGTQALTTFDPALFFAGNIVHGGVNVSQYPPDNYYPATVDGVGFVNYGAGDYRLQPTSPYAGLATDGADPGPDIPAVESATGGVVQ